MFCYMGIKLNSVLSKKYIHKSSGASTVLSKKYIHRSSRASTFLQNLKLLASKSARGC